MKFGEFLDWLLSCQVPGRGVIVGKGEGGYAAGWVLCALVNGVSSTCEDKKCVHDSGGGIEQCYT